MTNQMPFYLRAIGQRLNFSKGFLNPRADEDLAKTTEFQATVGGLDKDARRFMMKFEFRDPLTMRDK